MDFVKINQIVKNLRLFSCLLCCLILVFGSSFQSLAAISSSSNEFAVYPDYLIGSASNADPYSIATMELTDEDYYIQPFSTLGTVSNTIGNDAFLTVTYFDKLSETYRSAPADISFSGNRFHVSFNAPSNSSIYQLNFRVPAASLPSPGTYNLSFDYSSDFAYDYLSSNGLIFNKYLKNASMSQVKLYPSFSTFSGDIYLSPYKLNLASFSGSDLMVLYFDLSVSDNISQIGGSFAFHFEKVSNDSTAPSTGPDYSSEDYEADVSGSLSDISSSIGDISSSMDSAAENLEYISTSQNLIIQGIDNVIMHISDQLYAFWDQLYNLIHEPTYARLGDILDAIRNLDLDITVEMKEVTDAVNKMNLDMQNKLQNVQQTLTGGYDSSSMDSDNQELNSSLNEYEAAENELFDDAKENINSFEFDTDLGEFSTPLTDISYFLGSLFVGLGPMNVVISFSLTLSIAMVLIGWYRFKGGS